MDEYIYTIPYSLPVLIDRLRKELIDFLGTIISRSQTFPTNDVLRI